MKALSVIEGTGVFLMDRNHAGHGLYGDFFGEMAEAVRAEKERKQLFDHAVVELARFKYDFDR